MKRIDYITVIMVFFTASLFVCNPSLAQGVAGKVYSDEEEQFLLYRGYLPPSTPQHGQGFDQNPNMISQNVFTPKKQLDEENSEENSNNNLKWNPY
jgi:hypothetical protein